MYTGITEPILEEQTLPVVALHDEDGERGYERVARVPGESEQFAQLCDVSLEPREQLRLCLAHAFAGELGLDVNRRGHEARGCVEDRVCGTRRFEESHLVWMGQSQADGEVDPAVRALCALAVFWEVECFGLYRGDGAAITDRVSSLHSLL
jgi:hypothetical protein